MDYDRKETVRRALAKDAAAQAGLDEDTVDAVVDDVFGNYEVGALSDSYFAEVLGDAIQRHAAP